MNDYVTKVMSKHAKRILEANAVCVPDDPEEMNWRLFFAHSQDMLGFRADIFTGGPNEADNPRDPNYLGLRDRWTESRSMIDGLANLWDNPVSREQLQRHSNPFRSAEEKQAGVRPCIELLRGPQGNSATCVFADALDALKGDRIARRTNSMIRSYIQNAATLLPHGLYFRTYLLSIHSLPSRSASSETIEQAETTWVQTLQREFFNVGPALANYLVCDWLLNLWRDEHLDWFRSYKEDSVFIRTLVDSDKLPSEAGLDFARYCKSLKMQSSWTPDQHQNLIGRSVPPRLLNEAIWLEENRSS